MSFASEVLGGFGVLFEPAQRWSFFSLYLFPRWLESLQTFLGKRGYLLPVPFFKVRSADQNLMFALSCAIIGELFITGEHQGSGPFRTTLDLILGDNHQFDRK